MSRDLNRRMFVFGAGIVSAAGSMWPARAAMWMLYAPAGADPFEGAPPAEAPRILKRLVGEYGSEDETLIIYERDGRLHAQGRGMQACRLSALSPNLYHCSAERGDARVDLRFDPKGAAASSLQLKGEHLARRDFGAEVEARVRAGVRADADRLRATALAASPPVETGPKRSSELVALRTLDPSLRLDIRYATRNNFMGIPIYERAAAYLQRPAARALVRVNGALRRKGYGLWIYDAYRPWFATKMFWDAVPETSRIFVADPMQGSRHNRGSAVDLCLYELRSGKVVEMPGRYDEFSKRSFADYVGGTSRQRWHRDLLRREMERESFTVYPEEWWHFDHADWREYGIGRATFSQLEAARRNGSAR